MMQETAVLETDEQDQIGVVLANLEMSAVLYGTDELKPDSAQNVVSFIDRTIAVMEENGLTSGTIIKPWDK